MLAMWQVYCIWFARNSTTSCEYREITVLLVVGATNFWCSNSKDHMKTEMHSKAMSLYHQKPHRVSVKPRDNQEIGVAHKPISPKNQPQFSQTTMGQYWVKLSPTSFQIDLKFLLRNKKKY